MALTLHEALAELGCTTQPSAFPGKKVLIDAAGNCHGDCDAWEAWALVAALRYFRDEDAGEA